MKLTVPGRGSGIGLSESAKVILRYFRDNQFAQLEYELPDTIAGLFNDPEECERAETELFNLGLINLGPGMPRHVPVANRVRAAALTLEGQRFIAKDDLDG